MTRQIRFTLNLFLSLGLIQSALGQSQSSDNVKFNRDIRPLLSDRCFKCHGPDKAARKADMRLDDRDSAIKAGVFDLKNLPESEILARIGSDDPELVMPPPSLKKPLNQAEQSLIKQWVTQGATYEPHWAFVPVPEKVAVPVADQSGLWAGHPIDQFVLAKLKESKISHAPETDRANWLRRVSFDLTGLPPTLPELDQFLADKRPDPVAKSSVIDRLFKSPGYGERMAMDWLDVARFADTFGYQADRDMHTWPWRDWLIKAFQNNLSYDKFLTWQIAGDLLPNPTSDQILATAFNRLHRQTNEGGSIEEEFRVEYVSDRVRTAGTAFLGLTMECSRCHDHKYDPITQKEFYGFSAFFGNIDEHGLYSHFTETAPTPALPLYKNDQESLHKQLKSKISETEKLLMDRLLSFKPDPANTSASVSRPKADHEFRFDDLKPSGDYAPAPGRDGRGQSIKFGGDDAYVCQKAGGFGRTSPFSIALWIKPAIDKPRTVVFHTSVAAEDSAFRGYSLVLDNGIPIITLAHFWPGDAISIRGLRPLPINTWNQITVTWDGSSHASGLRLYRNGVPEKVEVVRDHLTRDITHRGAWGDSGGDVSLTLGARFRDVGFQGGQIDDLEVFNRELSPLEVAHVTGVKVEASAADLVDHARILGLDPDLKSLTGTLVKLRTDENDLISKVPQIMVMNEKPGKRRTAYVLSRGEYTARREEVEPQTPAAILPFDPSWPKDRRGLALWMTDPRHPLVSRVIVNRLWMQVFGRGLVPTIEDFGLQGQQPSHPELLDWLARDMINNGWDIQKSLRQMLLSATYAQSSTPVDPSLYMSDPENRLLGRGPRYRLSAEMIRDNSLAVSGLLVNKIGGASVKPYQPAGLWEEAGTGKSYGQDHGENLYRRSMYTYWRRTSPPPSMTTFDAPTREFCLVKRERTTTPLQALATLNDPQYIEAARATAQRLMLESPSDPDKQIATAFRLCTSQVATERQLLILKQLRNDQKTHFSQSLKSANDLLSTGESKRDTTLPAADHAALTTTVLALLNYEPCVTKR